MIRRRRALRGALLTLTLTLAPACDSEEAAAERAEVALHGPVGAHAEAAPAAAGPRGPAAGAPGDDALLSARVMPGAREAFARTLELIEEGYVDADVDLDSLYTGAIEGMLARLIQLKGHPVNALLGPDELAELVRGTQGSIVGVGVMIEYVADIVVIQGVIPGSPAARAGLRRGDRILGIDGARVQDMGLREVASRIRGEAGTEVALFVQRDTEEWTERLRRDTVQIQNVEARLLADGVGYLRLRGFAETTADELDAAIAALQREGMSRLVLDLRGNPGGLLDAAVAVTGRFLAAGETIVRIHDRKKGESTIAAEADGRWRDLPLAVLIGPKTASSAEIFADAIATHRRGKLIGQETMGKGSVESVSDLAGGWALKLSTGRFYGASGEARQGKGVRPDLPIVDDEAKKHPPIDEVDPATDAALGLAHSWLADRR